MTAGVQLRAASDIAGSGAAFKHIDDWEATKGWQDQSFSWVVATVGNFVHWDVVDSWDMIDMPMNQAKTGWLRAKNMEVGDAYNHLFKLCIDEESCRKSYDPRYASLITGTRFIFSSEHDNPLPSNVLTGLMGAIYTCPDCEGEIVNTDEWTCANGHHGYDAVSGLYFTKGIPPRPMAYGNPKNGLDDFRPQSVKEAVLAKKTIEVNGIAHGCAVWRKELFRKLEYPWFKTVQKNNTTGEGGGTQDLVFCRRAKEEVGARFGVNCAVKVSHLNLRTKDHF